MKLEGNGMARLVMDRRAAENKYLHRDFHVSGDTGLSYVGERYGDNGAKEYLRRFACAQYAPLAARVKEEGLVALKAHIEQTYETEEAADAVCAMLIGDVLQVEVAYCPGVRYMKSIGYTPSKWYVELTRTVNEAIADLADLGFELLSYDPEDGAASYRFFRRCF